MIIQPRGELEGRAQELFGFFMTYGRLPSLGRKFSKLPLEWGNCQLMWRKRSSPFCGSLEFALVGMILPKAGFLTAECIFSFYNTFGDMPDEEILWQTSNSH